MYVVYALVMMAVGLRPQTLSSDVHLVQILLKPHGRVIGIISMRIAPMLVITI